MELAYKFTVLGIPTAKGRPRFSRQSGRAYTPKKTQDSEYNFQSQAIAEGKPDKPLTGAISLQVVFFMPIPKSVTKKRLQEIQEGRELPSKKPDIDNLGKLVMDSLNGIFWEDDKQIVSLKLEKHYAEQPRAEVEIWHEQTT